MRNVSVKVVSFAALVLMLLVLRDGTKLFADNLKFTDVETEVSFWGRGQYQPVQKTIERTRRSIESLVAASNRHPSYRNLSASASAWFAYWATDSADRERFVQSSITAQTEAIKSRPAHRQSWIKLIEYLANTNNSSETEVWARKQLAGLQRYTKTP